MSAPATSTCRRELVKGEDRVYRLGDLIVAPALSAEMLAYAYMRFRQEDLLKFIFYEGQPGIRWFLEKYQELATLGCFEQVEGQENANLLGIGWLNVQTSGEEVYMKRCEMGMAFFRGVSPWKALEFDRIMIEWAFNHLGIAAMYGTTPEKNPTVLACLRRLGFEMFGPIPSYALWEKKPCGVFISAMTKEEWEERSPFHVGPEDKAE